MDTKANTMNSVMLMLAAEYQAEGNEIVARRLVKAALSLPEASLTNLYNVIQKATNQERG